METIVYLEKDTELGWLAIHFQSNEEYWNVKFQVYPITEWSQGKERGKSYTDKTANQLEMLDDFEPEKALKKLEGSVSWRGCWEGRLYFPEAEYWSEDLPALAKVFAETIEPWCKSKIREKCPHAE